MSNDIMKQCMQSNLSDLLQEYAESQLDLDDDTPIPLVPWHLVEECWEEVADLIDNWVENYDPETG